MSWGTTEQKRSYNAKVTDAAFVKRDDFGGNYVLELVMDADVEYDVTLVLSTGTGWDSDDKGKSVHHPTMEQFGERSNLGLVIESLVGLIEGGAKDLAKFMDGKDPRNADAWIGLDCFWEEESFTFKDRDTKKERTATRMLPTAYNGSAKSKKSDGFSPSRSVKAKLDAIAGHENVTSHDAFVDAVVDKLADELAADTDLRDYVNDASNWSFD